MYEYIKLLKKIRRSPQTFQSDYSRSKASLISEAASRGHITSMSEGVPLGLWHITLKGMAFLREFGGMQDEQETP